MANVSTVMGISGFGKATKKKQLDPSRFDKNKRAEEEPEFPGLEDEDDTDLPQFPVTHELVLKDHTKVVSALSLDPSGARILSGSHDYDVKLWDFGGMDVSCKPFKSWEPAGSYYVSALSLRVCLLTVDSACQINDLKYSNDGQRFLVVSGTTQAKLYDRDGEEQYVNSPSAQSWMTSPEQGDVREGRPLHPGHEAH